MPFSIHNLDMRYAVIDSERPAGDEIVAMCPDQATADKVARHLENEEAYENLLKGLAQNKHLVPYEVWQNKIQPLIDDLK